jgi:hypothetical protein
MPINPGLPVGCGEGRRFKRVLEANSAIIVAIAADLRAVVDPGRRRGDFQAGSELIKVWKKGGAILESFPRADQPQSNFFCA